MSRVKKIPRTARHWSSDSRDSEDGDDYEGDNNEHPDVQDGAPAQEQVQSRPVRARRHTDYFGDYVVHQHETVDN